MESLPYSDHCNNEIRTFAKSAISCLTNSYLFSLDFAMFGISACVCDRDSEMQIIQVYLWLYLNGYVWDRKPFQIQYMTLRKLPQRDVDVNVFSPLWFKGGPFHVLAYYQYHHNGVAAKMATCKRACHSNLFVDNLFINAGCISHMRAVFGCPSLCIVYLWHHLWITSV